MPRKRSVHQYLDNYMADMFANVPKDLGGQGKPQQAPEAEDDAFLPNYRDYENIMSPSVFREQQFHDPKSPFYGIPPDTGFNYWQEMLGENPPDVIPPPIAGGTYGPPNNGIAD